MQYQYVVRDKGGKTRRGVVEAAAEKAALSLLRDQGYIVISLTPKLAGEFSLDVWWRNFRGVPEDEKVASTRQLATMVTAGLPLVQSLEILRDQSKNLAYKEILAEAVRDVQAGTPLSQSFGKHPKVFPPVFVSLIQAGEASGQLDKILERLADTMEKQRDFRAKTKGALLYPAIVTMAMVGVFILMIVFVIPKLSSMYESIGADLPLPTKVMLAIADLFTRRWWLLVLLIVGAIFGYRKFARTPYGEHKLAQLSLRLPIFGNLIAKTQLTEITRTLGMLIGAGIPIVQALEISAGATDSILYREVMADAGHSVEKGTPLSEPFRNQAIIPPIIPQMIAVGEQTGKVDEVLTKVSRFFETESEQLTKNLSTALEPLIMIVLGAMVGLLIFSIITPIYQLTSQF